ncbi:DUF2117 domain-containing protein [Methanosphaera sp. Vir-13MRS]|uniref:DUF2117 domain-containing protein n=1 Tax=Candidatus Methanosphaera massiliense TaxID=3017187 RepID=UPI002380B100|nr:DUF2117 domain-containing protein [Candidatus Methanosphaera massiliense]MDE4077425.1 DUF2117 domain-containing protein [Candidatus Methanosphaera massiliense]
MTLRIGVIVHGPGIIDSGYAKKIIEVLSKYGVVSCKLGGTMGRTAVIDGNLEDIIDISEKLLPSQSIKLLSNNNDVLFLLNYGKSTVTGHTFGYKVLGNAGNDINLVQIERPGEDDGTIIQWNEKSDVTLINSVATDLNLPVIKADEVKSLVKDLTGYDKNNSRIERKIAGVSPGENIMVNGTIVGKATSDELVIIGEDNHIVEMIGGIIKQHGLEKLGEVDLSTAIVKTGLLRKADNIKPRIIEHESNDNLVVAFLDHAAEDIYKYRDVDLLVSVGDDTTLLSSDILYRFNIPIIGITDGDLDKVVLEGFKHKDSIIIQVEQGNDDIIGHKIHDCLFDGKEKINIDDISTFTNSLLDVIDKSGLDYKFVDKQLE